MNRLWNFERATKNIFSKLQYLILEKFQNFWKKLNLWKEYCLGIQMKVTYLKSNEKVYGYKLRGSQWISASKNQFFTCKNFIYYNRCSTKYLYFCYVTVNWRALTKWRIKKTHPSEILNTSYRTLFKFWFFS